MTSEDVKSEIDKEPFKAMRIHMVSRKTIDILQPNQAYMLQNTVMIVRDSKIDRYDIVALRNIERLEQLE
jgi:hypothetical protein